MIWPLGGTPGADPLNLFCETDANLNVKQQYSLFSHLQPYSLQYHSWDAIVYYFTIMQF